MGRADKVEHPTPEEYFPAKDFEWLKRVAEYDRDDPDRLVFADDGDCSEVCSCYAGSVVNDDTYWFLDMLQNDSDDFTRYAKVPDYGRCLVLCLSYCIDACESVHAMRWLGFMHQIGRFVEHDAHKAAQLYKMAEMRGDCQSMINLGYLYEYGHLGEPDLEAAFKQYAKVMALGAYPEAIYKVGDAYARAQVVERDLRTAYRLYKKCYDNCGNLIHVKAQAAFRLAELVVDERNGEWDIPYDPVMALHYYQVAEIGMRIDVASESPWYAEDWDRRLPVRNGRGRSWTRWASTSQGGSVFN